MSKPKPNFAFGLKLNPELPELECAERMYDLTYPHVSPYCIDSTPDMMTFPFLILESKSLLGNYAEAYHQMANALIKSLDVIAALHLEKDLFAIGISQLGFSYEIYLAYSTMDIARQTRKVRSSLSVTDTKYVIQLLAIGNLNSINDMIRLLLFLEAASNYGRNVFQPEVIKALLALAGSVPSVPGL